jgi:hypothetical protein
MEYLVETYSIYEATVLGEWKQLTDEDKQRYALIISCSKVNLSEGAVTRDTLWSLFKGNSTTRANLEALLNPVPPPYP